ncbi:MAG: hypothetical protein F6K23_05420 [Okeania sp. SIO2C9]|nr:hypothetical protein [Okeania sp. SIO2C9]NEQ72558.1 hypothetical protein [Okeania sp. SIO2C9]
MSNLYSRRKKEKVIGKKGIRFLSNLAFYYMAEGRRKTEKTRRKKALVV